MYLVLWQVGVVSLRLRLRNDAYITAWCSVFDVTIIELNSVGIVAVVSRYHAVEVAFFTLLFQSIENCKPCQHFVGGRKQFHLQGVRQGTLRVGPDKDVPW